MPNLVLDSEGNLVEAGDPNATFAKNSGGRLIYAEGSEPDDAVLESLKPGLAKEVRAKIKAAKADEKEAEEPVGEGGEQPVEEKAVEPAEAEDKSRMGPRGGRH